MEKPKNNYKPGTIMFQLVEEDWSRKSVEKIAEELISTYDSVKSAIYKIKRETGYQVPYLHLTSTPNRYKKGTFSPPVVLKKKSLKVPNRCDTCWNTDCVFMSKRKAVCWKDCSGWIGENI